MSKLPRHVKTLVGILHLNKYICISMKENGFLEKKVMDINNFGGLISILELYHVLTWNRCKILLYNWSTNNEIWSVNTPITFEKVDHLNDFEKSCAVYGAYKHYYGRINEVLCWCCIASWDTETWYIWKNYYICFIFYKILDEVKPDVGIKFQVLEQELVEMK